jgi:hypothetical protein
MGSGKSTALDAIIARLEREAAAEEESAEFIITILVVTYRQSLAMEHTRKLADKGFISYLDVQESNEASEASDLSDRASTPRVICQIESLHKLGRADGNLGFDLVILDECESLFRHYTSPTVKTPDAALSQLLWAITNARYGTIALDATLGAATVAVFKLAQLPMALVINDRPPASPRTFEFSKDEPAWKASILADLRAGLNVVVVSLSSELAMEILRDASTAPEGEVPACSIERCIIHTSQTGDDVKNHLVDVDALWTKYQLLVYR